MGLMRFLVADRSCLAADAVERAYFTGLDEVPWRSRTQWTDEGIAIRRSASDSGNLHIPWLVPGVGELSLSTACLMEKEAPYQLAVELARGTIHRIRNQLASWQAIGIQFGERLPLLSKALDLLSRATTSQHEPATAEAFGKQAITVALECMSQLGRAYADSVMGARRKQASRPMTVFGANLGSAVLNEAAQRYVVNTFNASVVPFAWPEIELHEGKRDWSLADRQVEWSRANNLKVLSGPLLQFDRTGLPPWIYLYEDDVGSVHTFVKDYVEAVVARYRGRVNIWQCAARMNVDDTLELSEEERLRLAALTIETIHSADPRTPVTMVIDQPWAEFMRSQDCDFSPFYFADALVRADLGLSCINLEINLGYVVGATQLRDGFDFLRQIDRWTCLGLPLLFTLTAPSSIEPDAKARSKSQPLLIGNGQSISQTQARWVEQLLPLILAKPNVQGVVWNQLLDSVPHELANAGLFDTQNQPKPIAAALREVRQKALA
jgi:hypothetical protein